MLLYVNHMLIVAMEMSEIKLKKQLNGEFEMKDLGTTIKILGNFA